MRKPGYKTLYVVCAILFLNYTYTLHMNEQYYKIYQNVNCGCLSELFIIVMIYTFLYILNVPHLENF